MLVTTVAYAPRGCGSSVSCGTTTYEIALPSAILYAQQHVGVRQAKGLQQRLELEKHLIFPTAEDIRQDRSRAMINGMPEPTRVAFVAVG